MTITPSMAAKFLEKNTNNRPLRAAAVSAIAGEITAGRWIENGATIVFATDGTLLDGQHRLAAIVLAGIAVSTYVVFGVANSAYSTMDSGGAGTRTKGDVLKLSGYADTTQLATVLSWIHRYHISAVVPIVPMHLSNQMTLDLAAKHPEAVRSLSLYKEKRGHVIGGATIAAVHALLTTIDTDQADRWLISLCSGQDLHEDDPVLVCRNTLIVGRTKSGGLPNAARTFVLCVTSWNRQRAGLKGPYRVWMSGKLRQKTLLIDGMR